MAQLRHSHLVDVKDFFESGENVYLVMGFVEGESLAERINSQGALDEAEVLEWAHQLMDALEYCHRRGGNSPRREPTERHYSARWGGDAGGLRFGEAVGSGGSADEDGDAGSGDCRVRTTGTI